MQSVNDLREIGKLFENIEKPARKEIRRGDIYYVKKAETIGCEQQGGRPAVILQNNTGNRHSPTVIIAYITAEEKKELPVHVNLKVIKDSIVLLEQIFTVDKSRIMNYLGSCTREEMKEIEEKLVISLGISESITEGSVPKDEETDPVLRKAYQKVKEIKEAAEELQRIQSICAAGDSIALVQQGGTTRIDTVLGQDQIDYLQQETKKLLLQKREQQEAVLKKLCGTIKEPPVQTAETTEKPKERKKRNREKPNLEEVKAYYADHSNVETAQHFNISQATLGRFLKENGISKPRKSGQKSRMYA